MIEPRRGEDVHDAAAGAGLRVTRAEHDTPEPRMQDRPGAHRARLDRRVNINARQPVVSQLPGGLAKSNDFSVSCGIAVGTRTISGNSDEFVLANDASADGHLAVCLRFASGGHCQPHPLLVKVYFRGAHTFFK